MRNLSKRPLARRLASKITDANGVIANFDVDPDTGSQLNSPCLAQNGNFVMNVTKLQLNHNNACVMSSHFETRSPSVYIIVLREGWSLLEAAHDSTDHRGESALGLHAERREDDGLHRLNTGNVCDDLINPILSRRPRRAVFRTDPRREY
jgi:hypothetical protein